MIESRAPINRSRQDPDKPLSSGSTGRGRELTNPPPIYPITSYYVNEKKPESEAPEIL